VNVKSVTTVLTVFAICVGSAFGQGDFFWSTSDLNSGAANSDPFINLFENTSGSLYLYYSTDNSDIDTGAGLDLSWDVDGVVAFTAAETFDYNVVLSAAPEVVIGQRWGSDVFPNGVDEGNPAASVTQNNVTGLNAFEVISGTGILESQNGSGPFLDQGYDSGADAFLFARVDWERIGSGTANLITEAGTIGIVNGAQTINPTFGGAQFSTIPEPTSASILAIGLVGLMTRRRRG